jgi:tRNA A-37 threonylcarbamoyl transferase component Bud32
MGAVTLNASQASQLTRSTDRYSVVTPGARGVMQDWFIEEGLATLLLGPKGLRLDEWRRQDVLSVVKSGPHRTVYRLRLPSGVFFIKHVHMAHWRARLKNLVRANQAEREWNAAARIARLGVPTFERAALGRVSGGGSARDGYLITRAIPQSQPLDQYLQQEMKRQTPRSQADLRRSLAARLGHIMGALHSGGVEHSDLHAANFLVRAQPEGGVSLWLIDLHSTQFHKRSLPHGRRMTNLAMLFRSFAGLATRSDRWRFWRSYVAQLGLPARPPRAERARLLKQHRRLAGLLASSVLAGWRRADAAWARGNRHVSIVNPGARALAVLDGAAVSELCHAPEQLFAADHVRRWCKRTARRRVVEAVVPIGGAQWHLYAKCVERPRNWARRLFDFRWKSARRAWELGHALLRRGIDTPRPLFFAETVHAGLTRSYLATEALPGVQSADMFMKYTWPLLIAAERRAWVSSHARRLALQLRRLHACGFDHRDLKFANLLVGADPRDARTWILDLEGVRGWRRLPLHRAVQNLARLAVSAQACGAFRATDFARFLRNYLADESAGHWKSWWRAIARAGKFKVERNRSAGRPLT